MPTQLSRLTIREVVQLLGTLEPRSAPTERQVRYLDARLGVVAPMRAGESSNAGRLYGPLDVALLRLTLRVLKARSFRQAWAAVRYLERDVRNALAGGGQGLALVFEGPVARVEKAPRQITRGEVFELASCVRGVAEAMARVRQQEGAAWTGNRWIEDPSALATRH